MPPGMVGGPWSWPAPGACGGGGCHRVPPGLDWGRGCLRIHVPAGLAWGWMGQWGCPLPRIIFLVHRNPPGPGMFPQRGPGTAPSVVLGCCGAANAHCLSPVPQGNDVLEDEDASPTQEDGKRPRVVVVPFSCSSLPPVGS